MSGSSSDSKIRTKSIVTATEARELLPALEPLPAVFADLAHTVVRVTGERDWLATALQQQEAAYAALEAQYLAVSDAHAHLVDQVSALAAEAIQ